MQSQVLQFYLWLMFILLLRSWWLLLCVCDPVLMLILLLLLLSPSSANCCFIGWTKRRSLKTSALGTETRLKKYIFIIFCSWLGILSKENQICQLRINFGGRNFFWTNKNHLGTKSVLFLEFNFLRTDWMFCTSCL